jgi:hypothetical protein
MKKELFNDLIKSVREAGKIRRDRQKPFSKWSKRIPRPSSKLCSRGAGDPT